MHWARANRASWVAVLFTAAGLLPQPAAAAGLWSSWRSAADVARGGANIVEPADPSGLASNPAALAGLRGIQLVIDGSMTWDTRQFTSGGATAHNRWLPDVPSPGIFASGNLASVGIPALTFGAGWFAPPHVEREYNPVGPERYNEVSGMEERHDLGLAVAYQLPWLAIRLGGTVLVGSIDLTHSWNVVVPPFGDAPVAVQGAQASVIGGLLAASLAPFDWLQLAASMLWAQDVETTGTMSVPPVPGLTGRHVDVRFHLPSVWRVGMQLHEPNSRWNVEAAWVWEGWGRMAAVTIIPDDLMLDGVALPQAALAFNWHDTMSFHVGGHVRLPGEPGVVLRAGAFYEAAAIDPPDLNVAAFDLGKWGGGVGARVPLWSTFLWCDVSVGYAHGQTTDVTHSRVRSAEFQNNQAVAGPVTGNGSYAGQTVQLVAALGGSLEI